MSLRIPPGFLEIALRIPQGFPQGFLEDSPKRIPNEFLQNSFSTPKDVLQDSLRFFEVFQKNPEGFLKVIPKDS